MQNLYDGLERIAGPTIEPTTGQIEADLTRGRRALRRRRAGQTAAGSVFAVAAVAAAFAFATAGTPAATTRTEAAPPATAPAQTPAGPSIELKSYTGKQPRGFKLDKVPDGWEVQGVDAGVLTLAPIGIKDQEMLSFEGKVAVMLQSVDDSTDWKGEEVKVGSNKGVLTKAGGQTTGWTLFVDRGSEPRLQVQVWDGLGWTGEQVVEFAAGITVTKDAQPGRG
ncbi:hypothetical protein AB0F81_13390 [Actinoplanes sp. NPDC024001]|uniref:hypothetical protein n=1 Tax=Actinoplanes sp. NPDC024001 TaxID=3154598 RepID=UPI0033EC6C48